MGKLKIKFHPIFILFFIILILSNNFLNVLSYLLCVFLHELGHYYMAKIFGYKLNRITFLPFGTSLSGKENVFYSKKHEVLVALSGPLVNLFLMIVCLALWWCFPVTYFYLESFYFANLTTLLFNFLPVYPLDGGRVLYALLSIKLKREKAYKILKVVGIIISSILFILFLISAFFKINFTLALVSIFLFSGLFFEDTSCYYQHNFNFTNKLEKLKVGIETNIISVNLKTTLYSVLKKLNKNKFNSVFVVNDSGKIITTITETKLYEYFVKFSLTDSLEYILIYNLKN